MRTAHAVALLFAVPAAVPTSVAAQRGTPRGGVVSAPVSDVRYEVRFDRARGRTRTLTVTTHLEVAGRDPLLLSLPAWTPGAYELSNFARNVSDFAATSEGKALAWDKLDFDTWRVQPGGAKRVTVTFDFRADSLDNAMAWSRDDFAFFNGTNLFLYPEGRELTFPATVTVATEPEWQVMTGMSRAPGATGGRSFASNDYHELVDMPFYVGAFAADSAQIAERWVRVATYPATQLTGEARAKFWDELRRMIPPMIEVFGEVPYEAYTNLLVFDESSSGGSALEHANSHLGIYSPFIIGNTALPSITAHEIFHVWNVKRLRPAELTPYRYDRAQPTTWLWVSEGVTDYYADLALVRGGIVDSSGFLALTTGKMEEVGNVPAVALEDASLSTWIHPVDGSAYIYYPKGSLAGFMLDVLIRDASDNAGSLDVVMRELYQKSYKAGRGFTSHDWWGAVTRAAKGKSFADFNARYIDGREPFPWPQILPLAGLKLKVDSLREPRIGVFTAFDSATGAVRVTELEEGGAAAEAGLRPGDVLHSIGDIAVNEGFAPRFRGRYGRADGQEIPVKITRDGTPMTLPLKVRLSVTTQERIIFDASASPKALRVRSGILTGRLGG